MTALGETDSGVSPLSKVASEERYQATRTGEELALPRLVTTAEAVDRGLETPPTTAAVGAAVMLMARSGSGPAGGGGTVVPLTLTWNTSSTVDPSKAVTWTVTLATPDAPGP